MVVNSEHSMKTSQVSLFVEVFAKYVCTELHIAHWLQVVVVFVVGQQQSNSLSNTTKLEGKAEQHHHKIAIMITSQQHHHHHHHQQHISFFKKIRRTAFLTCTTRINRKKEKKPNSVFCLCTSKTACRHRKQKV